MNRDQPGPKQNMATPSLSMGHPELLFNWPNLTHLILLHQFPRFITPKATINPKFGTPPQDKKGADYFTCASTFLSSNKVKSWFCWIVLLLLIIHITWHLSQMSKPRGIQWPEPRALSLTPGRILSTLPYHLVVEVGRVGRRLVPEASTEKIVQGASRIARVGLWEARVFSNFFKKNEKRKRKE